ncbi:MAG: hypothetical protein D6679_11330 [Candidatus Hydrogenedentota bacterium]|nr:MAG: hypothetical protein D6679_11330 [Candidatus Hydrogenedentota bacterium]
MGESALQIFPEDFFPLPFRFAFFRLTFAFLFFPCHSVASVVPFPSASFRGFRGSFPSVFFRVLRG